MLDLSTVVCPVRLHGIPERQLCCNRIILHFSENISRALSVLIYAGMPFTAIISNKCLIKESVLSEFKANVQRKRIYIYINDVMNVIKIFKVY